MKDLGKLGNMEKIWNIGEVTDYKENSEFRDIGKLGNMEQWKILNNGKQGEKENKAKGKWPG